MMPKIDNNALRSPKDVSIKPVSELNIIREMAREFGMDIPEMKVD